MALLGSKSNDLPVPQVKALSDRGYSENDIKDILRKKGYSENEINLTLQKALVAKVSSGSQGLLPLENKESHEQPMEHDEHHDVLLPPKPSMPAPPVQSGDEHHFNESFDSKDLFSSIGAKQEDLSFEKPGLPEPPVPSNNDHHQTEGYEIDLEPIVEAIVEEKWNDTSAILSDVQERLETLETMTKGGMKMDEVAQVEYLVKQTQERVERLEQSLDDVSIKVNSIEKAFKQFIPSLTGNIKALSDAVRHIRVGDTQTEQ